MIVACYGSLKKGFYNHGWLKGAELMGTSSLKGEMYLIGGAYPELIGEEDSNPEQVREHEIELYDVPTDVYTAIKRMEEGAGYYEARLSFPFEGGEVWASCFLVRKNHGGRYIEAYTKKALV